jgi:hypothetical protein
MIRQAFGEESLSRTRKVQTHRDRKWRDRWRATKKHEHHFLWHQGDCSKRICPVRTNRQLRIMLWSFTATLWKFAKTSPRNLETNELSVALRKRIVSRFLLHHGITAVLHPPYSPDLPPCDFTPFPRLKIKLKCHHFNITEVRHNLRRCWTPTEITTFRTHLKNGRNADRLCGLVVRVAGYRSRGPVSISGATKFSKK